MAGVAVISKTDLGTVMVRLVCNKEIVDRIEVDCVVVCADDADAENQINEIIKGQESLQ